MPQTSQINVYLGEPSERLNLIKSKLELIHSAENERV